MDTIKETDNSTVELLCRQSLRQHREMITLLQSLNSNLRDQSAGSIIEFNVIFTELQNQMQQTDLEVAQQLKSQRDLANITALWNRRKELQVEVLGLVGETVPKANSVKSLLANEMQAVKLGKKALNGYKSRQDTYGKIINKTL